MIACAFTGHRPKSFPWKYDEASPDCIALKIVLEDQIHKLADRGVTDFYSGLALGVDTWAAQAVLSFRNEYPSLKLHCILPCQSQAEKWETAAQETYSQIKKQADSVICLSPKYYDGCMLDRNRYLVDHSSILLAVYNGVRRGGTAMTVRYAQKLGREIIIIDPKTKNICSL